MKGEWEIDKCREKIGKVTRSALGQGLKERGGKEDREVKSLIFKAVHFFYILRGRKERREVENGV